MLRVATLVLSGLVLMPLIVGLAVAADARAEGSDDPPDDAFAAGLAVAVLYYVGGLVVFVRPLVAAALFLLAALLSFAGGREGGWDGLAAYGVVALALAGASVACSRN